jgi:ubiquinone/menaquinone biosynthesis C-methylase UbiE
MAVYDNFVEVMQSQPAYVQRMEKRRQRKIATVLRQHLASGSPVELLEVGVGTGQMALQGQEFGWRYTGIDRNQSMLTRLASLGKMLRAEVPPFPETLPSAHYDLAYSSFVVEHLADGVEAFHFITGLKRLVKPGGLVAIIVPDCLSLKMEFWNLDYTHRFPTTERNLHQIFAEAGLPVVSFIRYRGPFLTGLTYWLTRLVAFFYHYRLCNFLFGRRPFFYSVFQYLNQDILFFVTRVPPAPSSPSTA